jgi:hypothetical protein
LASSPRRAIIESKVGGAGLFSNANEDKPNAPSRLDAPPRDSQASFFVALAFL